MLLLFLFALVSSVSGFVLIGQLASRPRHLLTLLSSSSSNKNIDNAIPSQPQPIDPSSWALNKFPAKEYCSRCGLCETSFVQHVKESCAFLENGMRGTIDRWEPLVHNNDNRNDPKTQDELRFGILHQPIQLVRGKNITGAQWTGATTSIALAMLETNQVDAVVCVAQGGPGENTDTNDNWSQPEPIIARTAEDVLRGRGVKPSLSPNLRVLDEIQQDPTIQRLLFCGVGCAVQAFRAVQHRLTHVSQVYVLGTNCADNAPTPQAATQFIQTGLGIDTTQYTVKGYEFMQDYRVHVKLEEKHKSNDRTTNDAANADANEDDASLYRTKPYFSLPASVAEPSIAYSCRACFDYTNALADVTIGYMGAPIAKNNMRMDDPTASQQTLTIRNPRGAHMVQTALNQDRLWMSDPEEPPLDKGDHRATVIQTVMADTLVQSLYQDDDKELPAGMPEWLGNALATVLNSDLVGTPKGLAFARYSIDYHVLRNYYHVLHHCRGDQPQALKKLPRASEQIVQQYLTSNRELQEIQQKIQQTFVGE